MAEKVKLSVNLAKEDVDSLKDIAEKHGITMTDALRRAIAMERFVEEVTNQGGTLVVEDRDKSLRRVMMVR